MFRKGKKITKPMERDRRRVNTDIWTFWYCILTRVSQQHAYAR